MVKRQELSIDLRVKIVRLRKEKRLSYETISKRLDVPFPTVEKVIQKFEKTGTVADLPRSGRPKKLSDKAERNLVNTVKREPRLASSQLAAALHAQGIADIKPRTVRHILQKNGLHGCVARKKPYLTSEHKKQRRDFAQRFVTSSTSFFRQIIWSDETKVNLFGSDGRRYVRRRLGEGLLEKNLTPTVKYGGGSIMLWGCMSAAGVGELVEIEGTLNAAKYEQILEEKMLPSARRLVGRGFLFQQDNDSKHTAKSTQAYLKGRRIKLLGPWPSRSPDLSPIENCWRKLKDAVRDRKPRDKAELRAICIEEWNKISPDYCTKLVDSMPKRLAAVIAAKGGHTKY